MREKSSLTGIQSFRFAGVLSGAGEKVGKLIARADNSLRCCSE
jgi:hypothetical protein